MHEERRTRAQTTEGAWHGEEKGGGEGGVTKAEAERGTGGPRQRGCKHGSGVQTSLQLVLNTVPPEVCCKGVSGERSYGLCWTANHGVIDSNSIPRANTHKHFVNPCNERVFHCNERRLATPGALPLPPGRVQASVEVCPDTLRVPHCNGV